MTSRHVRTTRRYTAGAVAVVLAGVVGAGTAFAAPTPSGPIKPAQQERQAGAVVPPALARAKGNVTVSLRLSEEPLAASVQEGALRLGKLPSHANQQSRTNAVRRQQADIVGRAAALGARRLGGAYRAANVVAFTVPAAKLQQLAKLPGVVSVKAVNRYHTMEGAPVPPGNLALKDTALGVAKVRAAGITGKGVSIAVLDSGADFTHKNLGGPGTVAAYEACYAGNAAAPTGACAALFGPSAPKVKGGYDFVGETWDGDADTTEDPDPNPIDFDGHGTHVSDISAGRSADGTHTGMAPGADVYAVKVCSSIATACSGVAILEGIDWALDPNGDGDIADAVDVMNLSLGSDYGQPEDDATVALQGAVNAGVTVAAAAGNGSDRPFKVSSPSTAPGVISVAETSVPDAKLYPIQIVSPTIAALPGNTIRNANLQSWSPAPTSVLSAPLALPTGDPQGCAATDFTGFPAGAIALIRRGTCNASLKPSNAQAAGAIGAIIYNNAAGDPPSFSFGGGGPITIPTLTIALDKGTILTNAIKAGTVTAKIDPAAAILLTDTVVGTSSRGPRNGDEGLKPDVAAPGGWLSAEVGTGAEETAFGGTSGATPTITGTAALILQAHPDASPTQVKSRLLNGASTATRGMDSEATFYPAPVSRVGAGEVRADASVLNRDVLSNQQSGNGNLGFGLPHLTIPTPFATSVVLKNNGSRSVTYSLDASFREASDARAVSVSVPSTVRVPGHGAVRVPVVVTVNPGKLAQWPFTGVASTTSSGAALNAPEADGFVTAEASGQELHLGWQILPHRSADLQAASKVRLGRNGTGELGLLNLSPVQTATSHVYALTGTSPKYADPEPGEPGSPGSNFAVIDLAAAGIRDAGTNLEFAIASHNRNTTPLYPAGYEVDIDTNSDGTPDYAVYHDESGGTGASGLDVEILLNIATGAAKVLGPTVADFDSSTLVFRVPLAELGLSAGKTFGFTVLAYDNYFSGTVTDALEDMSWTVGAPAYTAPSEITVSPARPKLVTVGRNTAAGTSTQTGLLLLNDDARAKDFSVVTVSK